VKPEGLILRRRLHSKVRMSFQHRPQVPLALSWHAG